jgi:hypothetical protein
MSEANFLSDLSIFFFFFTLSLKSSFNAATGVKVATISCHVFYLFPITDGEHQLVLA